MIKIKKYTFSTIYVLILVAIFTTMMDKSGFLAAVLSTVGVLAVSYFVHIANFDLHA